MDIIDGPKHADHRMDGGHRWSGWPGAFCMYCGSEDIREAVCVIEHDIDCTTCVNPPCPVPDKEKDVIDYKLKHQIKP